jgi:hypothetical protein
MIHFFVLAEEPNQPGPPFRPSPPRQPSHPHSSRASASRPARPTPAPSPSPSSSRPPPPPRAQASTSRHSRPPPRLPPLLPEADATLAASPSSLQFPLIQGQNGRSDGTTWPPSHRPAASLPLGTYKRHPNRTSPRRTPHHPPFHSSHNGARPHHVPSSPPLCRRRSTASPPLRLQ